jgi:hypothetical protein
MYTLTFTPCHPFDFESRNQVPVHPPCLYTMSYYQLANLSEADLYGVLAEIPVKSGGFSAEYVTELIKPLLNPTGVWADYNGIWNYYLGIVKLAYQGYISTAAVPPPPRVSDFDNTTAVCTNWEATDC